jgi:hypothetical protein
MSDDCFYINHVQYTKLLDYDRNQGDKEQEMPKSPSQSCLFSVCCYVKMGKLVENDEDAGDK